MISKLMMRAHQINHIGHKNQENPLYTLHDIQTYDGNKNQENPLYALYDIQTYDEGTTSQP
jgi:hypothetical protein